MKFIATSIIVALVVTAFACTKKDAAPASPPIAPANTGTEDVPAHILPEQTPTPPPVNPAVDRRYQGPPVTVRFVNAGSAQPLTVAVIKVTAPTGGWTFAIDDTKDIGDKLQIFMTLEGPGADEWVTQSLVEHTQEFKCETPFRTAEVYVHLARRDIQTLTTDYRLAATSQPRQ